MQAHAQTDIDGLMMEKRQLCIAAMAGTTTFTQYWEGTLKRNNLNLGTVRANNFSLMANYGVTNNLNIMASLPYIKTKATAGQLAGQQGLQDASIFIKYLAKRTKLKGGILDAILVAGASAPSSNYTPDIMPLSLGLGCKNAIGRFILDYQKKHIFATLSGSYMQRSNVKLDRNTYYTTQINYTNIVNMPNACNINFRAGYRSQSLVAEAFIDQVNTLGGFDITRNNIPFCSNKMNFTKLGIHIKYETNFVPGLALVLDANTTLAGRNYGKSTSINAGVYYIINILKKAAKSTAHDTQ